MADGRYDFSFTTDGALPAGATLTRASTGWRFDATPALDSEATDAPRWTYSRLTGVIEGLLNEPTATNSIRNASAGGAAAGTPGTVPTNWTVTSTGDSVTRQIVGTGVEDGIPYIDVRYSGTPSGNGFKLISPEATTQVAALSGQDWIARFFARIVAGALTNTTLQIVIEERSGAAALANSTTTIVPTGAALREQRFDQSRTFNNASTLWTRSYLRLNYTSGQAIDVTIRVGLPNLVQASVGTSSIVTTSAAVTRAADVLTLTVPDGTYRMSVVRVSGTTSTPVTVSGGAWVVPTDASPVISVAAILSMNATMAAQEAGDVAAFNIVLGWPTSLPVPTLQGYSFRPSSAVDRKQVEFGASRVYRRTRQPVIDVPVMWQLNEEQQALLDGFQDSILRQGQNAFAIELLLPAGLSIAIARFKEKLSMRARGGPRWQTTATLELLTRPMMTEEELNYILGDEGDPPVWPVDILPYPVIDTWDIVPKPAVARSENVPGLPHVRQRSRNSVAEVPASWELSVSQAAIFDAFFHYRGKDGAQWFEFPFVQAVGEFSTSVRFIGDMEWAPHAGGRWSVSAPIEVRERVVMTAAEVLDA